MVKILKMAKRISNMAIDSGIGEFYSLSLAMFWRALELSKGEWWTNLTLEGCIAAPLDLFSCFFYYILLLGGLGTYMNLFICCPYRCNGLLEHLQPKSSIWILKIIFSIQKVSMRNVTIHINSDPLLHFYLHFWKSLSFFSKTQFSLQNFIFLFF